MVKLKTITASEGMVLTNGKAYGTSITLGANDNENNWYEITEEECQSLIAEQEKLEKLALLESGV